MTTLELVSSSETVGSSSTIPSTTGGQWNSSGGYSYGTGDFPSHYYPGYYPQTYGYTCPQCGVWVYSGNYHSCRPVVIPTVISYPVYVQSPPQDLQPLLDKLDELTEEVKKLRKQNKKAIDKA